MLSKSREHLSSAGETYCEHCAFAASVGLMALGAGLACLIHALLPGLRQRPCTETARLPLSSAGETYFEHFAFAASVGLMAVGAGLACLIHALVPALCQRTCSTTVSLLQELFADRSRLPQVTEQASGAMTFVGLLALA